MLARDFTQCYNRLVLYQFSCFCLYKTLHKLWHKPSNVFGFSFPFPVQQPGAAAAAAAAAHLGPWTCCWTQTLNQNGQWSQTLGSCSPASGGSQIVHHCCAVSMSRRLHLAPVHRLLFEAIILCCCFRLFSGCTEDGPEPLNEMPSPFPSAMMLLAFAAFLIPSYSVP